MATSRSGSGERRSSDSLMHSIVTADDPDKAITLGIIEQIQMTEPTLAEAIRLCAIPRRFNAEIIGVLREDPDESVNRTLLDAVATFTFVVTVGPGMYRYDETTRRVLLSDWQGADKVVQFGEINQRLSAYFDNRHEVARLLESDLWRVHRLIQSVSPSRYAQLAMTVESSVISPLLEVIYHESLISADAGFEAFKRYFFDREARGQFAICEALLNAARRDIHDAHPSEAAAYSTWLTYFDARLASGLGRQAVAEQMIKEALERDAEDPKLRTWLLAELGLAQESQTKYRQAAETYAENLSVQERHPDVDPWNIPGTYLSLAGIQRMFSHLGPAESGFRRAAELAREQSNSPAEFVALRNLSGVLQEAGRWTEAVATALSALHLVRTELRQDLARHRDVAEQLAALMVDHKPALADTAFQTGDALIAVINPGTQHFRHSLAYVELLCDSGQLRRGRDRLDQVKAEAQGVSDPQVLAWIELTEAAFVETTGGAKKAVALNSRVAQEAAKQSINPWERSVGLYRSAGLELACGMWADAEDHAMQAIQSWTEMGLDAYAAGARLIVAEVARHRGDLDAAQRIIEEVRAALLSSAPIWEAHLHESQGHVDEDRGEWASASHWYRLAVDMLRSLDNRKQAAGLLERLARMSGRQGNWEEAAKYTDEATTLWRALAELDRYQPTDATLAADKANARAIRLFAEADANTRYRLTQARDLFRQASERQPRNPWYLLNLSYACAALEEWNEACRAIETALAGRLEGLPEAFFRERLNEYEDKARNNEMIAPSDIA
jgi:tetratricopeptide (TPR) repeat protein